MIINTGLRTDIPAFYSGWLLKRIKEGYVYVRNPYYYHQVSKISLKKEDVDCLAFCTKNPHPLIPYLKELSIYKMFWFVTITPYGKDIEPGVPKKKDVIEDFKILSSFLGKESVALRYDPILMSREFDIAKHIRCFTKLVHELKGYIEDITISFLDLNENIKKKVTGIRPPTQEEEIILAKAFAKIAQENNITIHACHEKEYLKEYGLDITGCMSKMVLEKALKEKLKDNKDKKRENCNCFLGKDIGSYNSCPHLCKYCYANYDEREVLNNFKKHNPNSPFLIGDIEKGDIIKETKNESIIERQLSLF